MTSFNHPKRILMPVVILFATLSARPVQAYDLFIINHSDADVVSISARPGKVEDFTRVRSGTDRHFKIAMPRGQCQTVITVRWDDGQTGSSTTNICGGLKLTLNARPVGH